jgi:nitrate reductase gamma subunit
MTLLFISELLALTGLLLCIYGLYRRYAGTKKRPLPADRSPLKGSPSAGVQYAFTTGMAPWAKESTRIHSIAYLRGIGFHIGIFAALAALIISPLWGYLPAPLVTALMIVASLGAVLGAAGGVMRIAEQDLRGLSTIDDHFAVWIVTAFMVLAALAMWNPAALVPFYIVSAVMLVYIPLGKIRHCLYFFFSRTFFGKFFGRRAVFPHPQATASTRPEPAKVQVRRD